MRYADDANIYVRSCRAGERVMAGVECFLNQSRNEDGGCEAASYSIISIHADSVTSVFQLKYPSASQRWLISMKLSSQVATPVLSCEHSQ